MFLTAPRPPPPACYQPPTSEPETGHCRSYQHSTFSQGLSAQSPVPSAILQTRIALSGPVMPELRPHGSRDEGNGGSPADLICQAQVKPTHGSTCARPQITSLLFIQHHLPSPPNPPPRPPQLRMHHLSKRARSSVRGYSLCTTRPH